MQLKHILQGIEAAHEYPCDKEVTSIELNSQNIIKGGLFIALSGKKQDGKKYIPDALQRGAAVVVYDGEYEKPETEAVFVHLNGDMRANIAKMTSNFYSKSPALISAVTGTNGKTSIADFTRQMMSFLGYKAASIGTIGVVSDVMENVETLTTPDSVTLHKILTDLANFGVDYVSMEASSVGIEQYRMDGLNIKVAGFTNLTQDHLDYHLTMENYFEAKKQLFSRVLSANGTAVLNADIKEFAELKKICKNRGIKVLSYGINGSDLKIINRVPHAEGQTLKLSVFNEEYQVELPLIGEFQAMNVLCALGMVIALNGHFDRRMIDYIPHIKGAPGRLDRVGALPNGAGIYVDYAHTPDALENVLETMRHHTKNKLWVVFGCGGDRDKLKRPIMGKIAKDLADEIVVTDDNPRSEDAAQIRREIMAECPKAYEIGDRIKAIKFAISKLSAGDMLVIAGKGHETGQKIGDTVIPMNDIEEARKQLAEY